MSVAQKGLGDLLEGENLRRQLTAFAIRGAEEIALVLPSRVAGIDEIQHAGWMIELARELRGVCVVSVIFESIRLMDRFSALGFDEFVRVYRSKGYYYEQKMKARTRRAGRRRRKGEESGPQLATLSEEDLERVLLHLYELGQFSDAVEAANHLLARGSDPARAYYYRGVCFYRMGAHDHAVEDIDRALALQPEDVDFRFFRGLVLGHMKLWERALSDLDHVVRVKPDHVKAFAIRAEVNFRAGRSGSAFEDVKRALERSPRYRRALYLMGRIYLLIEEHDLAEEQFRQAIDVSPDFSRPYFYLAAILARRGKPNEAWIFLEQAVELGFSDLGRVEAEPSLAAFAADPRMGALRNRAKQAAARAGANPGARERDGEGERP